MGGPVVQESLFLLHSDEWYSSTSKPCLNGLSVSSDHTMLQKIIDGNLPKNYKLMAGISTWHPRQLAMEIHKGGWLVINDPKPELFFGRDGKQAWTKAVQAAGSEAVDSFF